MIALSQNLPPIEEYELSLGNKVLRRDEDMWSRCPLAVVFEQPLHFAEIERDLNLPSTVARWVNRDTHYDIEAGFVCEITGHSISGPLAGPS